MGMAQVQIKKDWMIRLQNILHLQAIRLLRAQGITYPIIRLKDSRNINGLHFHDIFKFSSFIYICRIARFLRQSFRQSVRRFRGETSQSQEQLQSSVVEEANQSMIRNFPAARCKIAPLLRAIPAGGSCSNAHALDENFPPPDYATVIIETSRHSSPQGTIDPYERYVCLCTTMSFKMG